MWTLRTNLSPVLTQQDKEHDRNMLLPEVLVPLCCRAAMIRKVHFPSALRWVALRSLVSMAQEMLSMLWEDRLLRRLTAKLQRYCRACMKCNISASINGWHLDMSSTEALTLRQAFCKALSPSSRTEGRDCSGLKKIYQQTKIISTLWMSIIFRSRWSSHQKQENAAQTQY